MTDLSNLYCPNCRHQTLHLIRVVHEYHQFEGTLTIFDDLDIHMSWPEEEDESDNWVNNDSATVYEDRYQCHRCRGEFCFYEIILGNLESFATKFTSASLNLNSLNHFQLRVYNTDERAWDRAWRNIGWGNSQFRKLSFNLVNDQRLRCGLPEYEYEEFKEFLDNLSITEE